jgi:uncharacterized protein (DUF58 family)
MRFSSRWPSAEPGSVAMSSDLSGTTGVHVRLADLVRLEFIARDLTLLPRQPIRSLLSGRHSSRLRGRGLAFEELRDYRPGDDLRAMDWRATARRRRPHVRVYSEERDRPVLLVVDQRNTMFFGSARATKATAAAEVAALAAWRALAVGDRVGAIIFGDEQIVEIKPHRSRERVLRICHELERLGGLLEAGSGRSSVTTLNDALRRAANLCSHDHLVVLITDYQGDDEQTRLLATRLATHNDVLAVMVYDPLGIAFNPVPGMEATDGADRATVPSDPRFGTRFREAFVERAERLRTELRALRVPVLPICTHDPVPDQLRAAFGRGP